MQLQKGVFLGVILCTFMGLYPDTLLLAQSSPDTQNQYLQLDADQLRFDEKSRVLTASQNVHLQFKDVEIKSERILYDVDLEEAWGTGNIEIKRGNDEFKSDSFRFNVPENTYELNHINVFIDQPDSTESLHIIADHIRDTPGEKTGYHGLVSSCTLDRPHYHVKADRFTYTPDEHIEGYNVQFWGPILFIPFGFWTPYYKYSLGPRDIIWNFPTIGEKKTAGWGWFVQNTIDYDYKNGKDSSIFLDWFQNKGIGAGIRHQYDFFDDSHRGSIYYYHLTETDTQENNDKFRLEHKVDIDDFTTLMLEYDTVDAERISFSGRQEYETKKLTYTYDKFGDYRQFKFYENQNFFSKSASLSTSYSHRFNGRAQHDFTLNQNDSFLSNRRNISSKATHYLYFPDDITLKNAFDYTRSTQSRPEDGHIADDTLKSYTTLEKPFLDGKIQATVRIDNFYDLEGDAVTSDITSNKNRFLYKLPEIKLVYRDSFWDWDITEDLTFARYREVQYDSNLDEEFSYPSISDLSLEPNTYILKQKANRDVDALWGGTIELTFGMDQYLFKTPGRSLFDSDDAILLWYTDMSYSADLLSFLKTTTGYDKRFVYEESNSPFPSFQNIRNTRREEVSQSLDFYLFDISKYKWSHKLSYDFERQRFNPYSTSVLINPNPVFYLLVGTGITDIAKDFTPVAGRNDQVNYTPLNWNVRIAPTKNISLVVNHGQDLNFGRISNSSFTLKYSIGTDPDYQWDIEHVYRYSLSGNSDFRQIEFNRYEPQTIRIVKHDHCRTFTLAYNYQLEELKFKYTINAFPNDVITYKADRFGSKIEGVLDDQTEERF
jgi:hypothetical protein